MRIAIVLTLGLMLAAAGCGGSEPAGGGGRGSPEGGTGPAPAAAKDLLVGTWTYDLVYPNGDAVPCVRVIRADGTGEQYATEAGPDGAQAYRWTLSPDGRTLTLDYGKTMTVEYAVEKLEGDTLVMTAKTENARPEECKRR